MKRIFLLCFVFVMIQPTAFSKAKETPLSNKRVTKYSVSEIAFAEYVGKETIEDVILDRNLFAGKVVKLKYDTINQYSFGTGSTGATLYADDYEIHLYVYIPDDRDAREWVMDEDKKDSSGSVYVLIGKRQNLVLGTRRKKDSDGGYSYSW